MRLSVTRYSEMMLRADRVTNNAFHFLPDEFYLPTVFGPKEALTAVGELIRILNQSGNADLIGEENFVKLQEEYARIGELESLAIDFVAGRAAMLFKSHFTSALTSGLMLSLELQLSHVIDKKPNSMVEFMRLARATRDHFSSMGETDFRPQFKRPIDEKTIEDMKVCKFELDEALESLWLYGAINGEDWV